MAGEGPLIGRVGDLRLLEAALDGTDGYRGCVIAGQAGVGKSRLAHELVLRSSSAGISVRSAVGTASARTVPLGALAGWCDHPTSNPLQLIDSSYSRPLPKAPTRCCRSTTRICSTNFRRS